MTMNATTRKLVLEELSKKVDKLSVELSVKKVVDKFTPLERKQISVILNEIKYNTHRMKNMI